MLSRQGVQVGTLHVVVGDSDGFDALVVDVNDRCASPCRRGRGDPRGRRRAGGRHGRLRRLPEAAPRLERRCAVPRRGAARGPARAGPAGRRRRRGGPRRCCAASALCSSTPSRCSRARTSSSPTRGWARWRERRSRRPTGAAAPSSTGRMPPACCPSRSGRCSAFAGATSAPAAGAGTRCPRTRARSVLDALRANGPMTVTELGGARRGGEWWDWSDVKIAVEWLLDVGEVVCTERRAWKRVYDLPERALPPEVLADDPDDATCLRRLVGQAGVSLGVATVGDLADYHRLKRDQVRAVRGGDRARAGRRSRAGARPAWADPGALAALATRGRHRTTLLSPFDSLVWDRARTLRVFDFQHRLEAYVPAPKRVHGYFAMPLLAGGRLRGPRRPRARRHDAGGQAPVVRAGRGRRHGPGAARGGGVGRLRRGRAPGGRSAGARRAAARRAGLSAGALSRRRRHRGRPVPQPPLLLPLPPGCCRCRRLLPLPPMLPLRRRRRRRRRVVAAGAVVASSCVVPSTAWAVVAFCLGLAAAFGADCAAVEVVFAGARRTPEPTGVGARPIESREIALAARPTATARASPTTARIAVRSVPGPLMASPSAGSLAGTGAGAPRPGSAARPGCRRRGGR